MLTDLKRNSRATNRRLMQKALLRGIFHAEAIYPFFVVIASAQREAIYPLDEAIHRMRGRLLRCEGTSQWRLKAAQQLI